MATFAPAFSLLSLILHIHLFSGSGSAKTLTIQNNCSYTVWPAISTSSGSSSSNDSGFALQEAQSSVVTVPSDWNGRVWGRTLCSTDKSTGNFSCLTGDCATGRVQCSSSDVKLVTLAEFGFGQLNNLDFYDVSVVAGYNLPLVVAPYVDSGPACDVTGCVFDLQKSCLAELTVVNNGSIIACNNPCTVFKTDQFCCNSETDCQHSNSSLLSFVFKQHCPRAESDPRDDATSTFACDSSRASSYKITFCPSPAMSRLLSLPYSQALAPALGPEADTSSPKAVSPIPLSPTSNSTNKPTHPNISSNSSKRKVHTAMMIAFPTAAGIVTLLLLALYLCVARRKAIKKLNAPTDEMKRFADSLQLDFNTIRLATNNFAPNNKLGQGGFGEVYKGELVDGQEIAVKRLSKKSVQGIAEFEAEIVLVARLQHKNLVKLLGYCASSEESLLVYEFLPNSSLDRSLFDPAKKSSLDWRTRFNIISGIARGLLYLHEDSRIKVVHRDLKSGNILLDEAMNPKIADFGLARLFGVDQTQGNTVRIAGTYGYMAPEYAMTGRYSVKSDVYSFGVMVLEIISGQRNRFDGRLQVEETLVHRAWRLWNEGEVLNLIDTDLEDKFKQEEVLKCIQIGLLCIQENAVDRPRMTSVVAALYGRAIHLPTPKPPQFFGCAVDNSAQYVYTGDDKITSLYSRD